MENGNHQKQVHKHKSENILDDIDPIPTQNGTKPKETTTTK